MEEHGRLPCALPGNGALVALLVSVASLALWGLGCLISAVLRILSSSPFNLHFVVLGRVVDW